MLLERDHELSVLGALAAAAARGQPGLLVVEGPAGIGKTRLLSEARLQAGAAGVRVLMARGSELEQELAFGAVRQLFEATISGSALEGAAATAREVFDGPASGASGEESSFAILHGLYRLAVNLAEQAPLLLVVDDLQWTLQTGDLALSAKLKVQAAGTATARFRVPKKQLKAVRRSATFAAGSGWLTVSSGKHRLNRPR